ncbi:hypothetical protein KC350_g39 [Hortaea werneckii]|nr:hypothetical protein KC350_g39 [Hortaea werneckii]
MMSRDAEGMIDEPGMSSPPERHLQLRQHGAWSTTVPQSSCIASDGSDLGIRLGGAVADGQSQLYDYHH